MPTRHSTTHVIAGVTYHPIVVTCICDWQGPEDAYNAHKKEAVPVSPLVFNQWKKMSIKAGPGMAGFYID